MQQFIVAATMELESLPADLVLEALAHVRKTVTDERAIVPGVFEWCEDYPKRRRQQLDKLRTLGRAIETEAACA